MMGDVEIDEVIKKSDGHFFSKGAMNFFQSRTSQLAWPFKDGYLFWTSEKMGDNERLYTVRYQTSTGVIRRIGSFQAFSTAVRAVSQIKTILARGEFPAER